MTMPQKQVSGNGRFHLFSGAAYARSFLAIYPPLLFGFNNNFTIELSTFIYIG